MSNKKTIRFRIDKFDVFDVPSGKDPVRQRPGAGAHARHNRQTRSEAKAEGRAWRGKL